MEKLLITGAAGYLGRVVTTALADSYQLRLLDRVPLDDPRAITADLADLDAVLRATDGVDKVLHLGGQSLEAPWDDILRSNIDGTYNVLEAAHRAEVRRVVFASSHHTIGFYRRERLVGPDDPVRPDSRYGVSKVAGEALARLYADKHGLSIVCQRIGIVRPRLPNRRALQAFLSERDYVQLTRRCLEAPDIHYLTVFGVSANPRRLWDVSAAERIGFVPEDNAELLTDQIAGLPEEGEIERLFHGGAFCAAEMTADPDRID